jgi:DNA-binding transcriptional LysR family regulator
VNLVKVRTFLKVVEHKNFSTVADLLEISQPAVSKQIKTLEEELGIPLLNRETNDPTDAGRIVYQKGLLLLQQWEELVEACKQLQNEVVGTLSIGASSIPSSFLLPNLLREFKSRFPRVDLRIHVQGSDEIVEQVRTGKLDVGLVGTEPPSEWCERFIIAEDQLVVIGPSDSEVLHGFEELRRVPVIARQTGSGTWKAAQEGFHKWSGSVEDLQIVARVNSTETAISLVETGFGYTVVSDLAAIPAAKLGRIKIVSDFPVKRNFFLTYMPAKKHNSLISAWISLFHDRNTL